MAWCAWAKRRLSGRPSAWYSTTDRWLAEPIIRLAQMGIHVQRTLASPRRPSTCSAASRCKVAEAQARQLRADAIARAGRRRRAMFECVPSALAKEITEAVKIPVIGIGAGSSTDGQVAVVMHDMLGLSLSGRSPKFVKNFLEGQLDIQSAFAAYVKAVKDGTFPGPSTVSPDEYSQDSSRLACRRGARP